MFYTSRRQCDDWIKHVQKNGPREVITFAQRSDPCIGIFGKLMSSWKVARRDKQAKSFENVSVTVQLGVPGLPSQAEAAAATPNGGHPSRPAVWLGTDANMLREIDPETMEPLGVAVQADLHPSLDGPFSCAHAERCPITGDYFNINIKPGRTGIYRVFRVSATSGKTEILAEFSRIDLPVAYIHSFFLSEHFVVLRVPCSHLKTYGVGVLWEKNIMDAIVPFDEKNKTKWFVVDRLHGRGIVAEFETDAAFFFHTVNCFEEAVDTDDGALGPTVRISCDVVEYPTMNILHALYYDVMMDRDGMAKSAWGTAEKAKTTLPRLVRWKFTVSLPAPSEDSPSPWSFWNWLPFSLVSTRFQPGSRPERPVPEQLVAITAPHAGELPTINTAFHTRRHRYVYSLSMSGLSTFVDSIIKTDVETQKVLRWNNPRAHTPGEAIFVSRPEAVDEDDGVLLSVVLDGICGKSYLLCLDARTMCEMGRAEMDFAVGFGFHGVHTTEPTRRTLAIAKAAETRPAPE